MRIQVMIWVSQVKVSRLFGGTSNRWEGVKPARDFGGETPKRLRLRAGLRKLQVTPRYNCPSNTAFAEHLQAPVGSRKMRSIDNRDATAQGLGFRDHTLSKIVCSFCLYNSRRRIVILYGSTNESRSNDALNP